jgi:predicted RecB family nuclease
VKRTASSYGFSPSDLINYVRSEFITWMERWYLDHPSEAEPDPDSEEMQIVQDKGIEHERHFLATLKTAGRGVTDFDGQKEHFQATIAAMRRGDEIIYQGYLQRDEFAGYPDFLVRVDSPSSLGTWSYEPWDTKLARHAKPYFLVQLCCYAEMIEAVQGVRPSHLRIVLGAKTDAGPDTATFRTDDFFFYYRALKEAFLEQQRLFDPAQQPEINPFADLGRWAGYAERILEERDDLALVANIRSTQRRKLLETAIDTVAALAATDGIHIPRLNDALLDRLRRQARLQISSRGKDRPDFELLPAEGAAGPLGLSLLPPASKGDIYFDMEGYPLIDEGREYLFGACFRENGVLAFRDWWAHDRQAEKKALEGFVTWAYKRWQQFPDLHIYHYNHYEVTAVRRLMGKYGVCEDEIDGMLRGCVFVDLFKVVRQGLLIGEPSYSLKYVEHLYRGHREGDVASAGESMVYYQRWLVAQDGDTPATSTILRQIRDYNEQDCRSTAELAEWLRERQHEAGIAPRSPAEGAAPSDELVPETDLQRRRALTQEMLRELPEERPGGPDGERRRITELLAFLLEFHRREEKPIWWHRFDRMEMEEQQLVDDPDCLGGLVRTTKPPQPLPKPKRSTSYEYSFDPRQETKLRQGDGCAFAHDWKQTATIQELDFDHGKVALLMGNGRGAPPDRLSLAPDESTLGKKLAEAVERVVNRWHKRGDLPSALSDFLFRRRPSFIDNREGLILQPAVDIVDGALNAALSMQKATLCIQGPPGCGKTYVGARMIAGLLAAKKRVGIASNSHRAINLLLAGALEAAHEQGLNPDAAKVCRDEGDLEGLPGSVRRFDAGKCVFGCEPLPQLIGGTVFAFSCEAADGRLDYLFVDEAGQVSVANLVAMGSCARNIVLLGDQMQLGQPIQGSHPGESGLSALEYLLQGQATVPDDFGIFLPRTWRLHPAICRFISGAVYEDRLDCQPHTARRVLAGKLLEWIDRPAGLVYVPVDHEGNVYESAEEADRIAGLVTDLLKVSVRSTNGAVRRLTPNDILIVAPYNMQVRRLERRLPNIRVGSVDKFQGQQAAVVIFSMCASTGDSSPRGVEFLFNRNRLNVAISRAETLAVVVGSPALVHTSCTTIEQMRLVNVYCRAVQEGTPVGEVVEVGV